MRQAALFPTFVRASQILLSSRLITVISLILAVLLPLMLGPYLMFLFFFNPSSRSAWPFDGWALSLTAILSVLFAGWNGRFHLRLGCALVALGGVWSILVSGLEWNPWTGSYAVPAINLLLHNMVWFFGIGAFSASLAFSVADVRFGWLTTNSPQGNPRLLQFSLRNLMVLVLVVCFMLAIARTGAYMHPWWYGIERLAKPPDVQESVMAAVCSIMGTAITLTVLGDRRGALGLTIGIGIALACFTLNLAWYAVTGVSWLRLPNQWITSEAAWLLVFSLSNSAFVVLLLRRAGLHLVKPSPWHLLERERSLNEPRSAV